jgi:HPt (histidine-containing phosphotransfer) domain-containing protein
LEKVETLDHIVPAAVGPESWVSITGDPLDDEIIASLRELPGDGDVDLLTELIDLFVSDAPPRLAEIRRALVMGDSRTVTSLAHSLKGSSANLGAHHMAGLCAELERQGRAGSLERSETLRDQIEREFCRVRQALECKRQRGANGSGQ